MCFVMWKKNENFSLYDLTAVIHSLRHWKCFLEMLFEMWGSKVTSARFMDISIALISSHFIARLTDIHRTPVGPWQSRVRKHAMFGQINHSAFMFLKLLQHSSCTERCFLKSCRLFLFLFWGDVTKLWNKTWMRELNKIKNSSIKRNDSSYLCVHMWNGFTQLAWRAKVQIWRFEVWVLNWRQWIKIWWGFFLRLIGALHFNFLPFSFSSCWSN